VSTLTLNINQNKLQTAITTTLLTSTEKCAQRTSLQQWKKSHLYIHNIYYVHFKWQKATDAQRISFPHTLWRPQKCDTTTLTYWKIYWSTHYINLLHSSSCVEQPRMWDDGKVCWDRSFTAAASLHCRTQTWLNYSNVRRLHKTTYWPVPYMFMCKHQECLSDDDASRASHTRLVQSSFSLLFSRDNQSISLPSVSIPSWKYTADLTVDHKRLIIVYYTDVMLCYVMLYWCHQLTAPCYKSLLSCSRMSQNSDELEGNCNGSRSAQLW